MAGHHFETIPAGEIFARCFYDSGVFTPVVVTRRVKFQIRLIRVSGTAPTDIGGVEPSITEFVTTTLGYTTLVVNNNYLVGNVQN